MIGFLLGFATCYVVTGALLFSFGRRSQAAEERGAFVADFLWSMLWPAAFLGDGR